MTKTIADELAKKQKQISVAEFFEKNRHLLGFANKSQALLTSVKEAVDNGLDACEEAKILPEIKIQLKELGSDIFKLTVEDNGPGIVKKQMGRIFGRFLYGSKFGANKQARGQQGIGISSVVLYAQLTTGKPATIISKTGEGKPAHKFIMHIDTKQNESEIVSSEIINWAKPHGTKTEFILQGKYILQRQSVPAYVKETAIVNPHAKIVYIGPDGKQISYPRVTEKLPKEALSIKPHPHGIEHGILKRMLGATTARAVKGFLTKEFDKVGAGAAKEILTIAGLDPKLFPKSLNADQISALLKGMQDATIMSPSTNCLSPIGAETLKKSLDSEYDIEFSHAITRPPTVYKGTPFQIEVAIGYGGELNKEGSVIIGRFANRVPLLYQEGSCAITKAIKKVSWKPYGLNQASGGGTPQGAAIILVHMASVWVPFTSEGKEAVAGYPDIDKEIRLALQECGRKLQHYVSKQRKAAMEKAREEIFKKYAGELAIAVSSLTKKPKEAIHKKLIAIAEKNLEALNGNAGAEDESGGEK